MKIPAQLLIGFTMAPAITLGCGLDWTLPQDHFNSVEEHGYVEYWEKIGEADLGNGLVIPIHISFNSHRESSSPTLGKGWAVALLESHVEPLDDNSLEVVMPDGWNYFFYRNGNTETWRGNAKWVGETKDSIFTITAPCGWRIKYDGGKIQEIDSNQNRTLTFKYNGPAATEADENGKPFVQVDTDVETGAAEDIVIGGRKIDISMDSRPQVVAKDGHNLVTGFDPSLSELHWPDGTKEAFSFGTDKTLNPTLLIVHPDRTQRDFTWDADTRQIKVDGDWTYNLSPGNCISYERTNAQGQSEMWFNDTSKGSVDEKDIAGNETITSYFAAGPFFGKIRKIVTIKNGNTTTDYEASYDEEGHKIREIKKGAVVVYKGTPMNILYDDGTSILDMVTINKQEQNK